MFRNTNICNPFILIKKSQDDFNIYLGYKQINLSKELSQANKFNEELLTQKININGDLKKLILYNYTTKLRSNNAQIHSKLNENKIVLYISENNCGNCVQKTLNYIETLSKTIGKDKLLFIGGNFKTKLSFKLFAQNLSGFIGDSVYCNDAGFPNEINEHPTTFILDKDLKIHSLFIPDLYPNFSEECYTKILPSYFEKETESSL